MQFVYFTHNTLQIPRVARQCMVALAEGVAQLGVPSEIVSFNVQLHPTEPKHPDFKSLYNIEGPLQVSSYRIPFARSDSSRWVAAWRLAAYFWHLFKVLVALPRSHILLAAGRNYSILAMLIVVRNLGIRNISVLADVHGLCTTKLARWVHANVDQNVCITAALAGALRTELRVPGERLTVAHTGVKPERFASRHAREESRKRFQLPEDRPLIVYTGKVHHGYEEISYLLQAAKLCSKEADFIIVGGRPDQIPPWREECQRLSVNNVKFTGFVLPAEIPDYLHAADLLVMYYSPSALNDFRSPGKLFEYLASGTPLIAARFRGTEEVVTDGVNGFLVDPYQPVLLAAKIKEVLGSPDKWEKIGSNARSTAAQFTWKHRAQQFISCAAKASRNASDTPRACCSRQPESVRPEVRQSACSVSK